MAGLVAWFRQRAWRWYVKHYLTDDDTECHCGACCPLD